MLKNLLRSKPFNYRVSKFSTDKIDHVKSCLYDGIPAKNCPCCRSSSHSSDDSNSSGNPGNPGYSYYPDNSPKKVIVEFNLPLFKNMFSNNVSKYNSLLQEIKEGKFTTATSTRKILFNTNSDTD